VSLAGGWRSALIQYFIDAAGPHASFTIHSIRPLRS
jgi:hypothetical protein